MKAFIFPGQGSQFPGMGKELYEKNHLAKTLFEDANSILGFSITKVMFEGNEEDLKQTAVTQPAIFLHSVILALLMGDTFRPDAVAGHSLGEFSSLVSIGALSFEDGLKLVAKRAEAMQKACNITPSSMAAVLNVDDSVVEEICRNIDDVVVPANYNSPGQIVISGTVSGIEKAIQLLNESGHRRILPLKVSGAFHSPLMKPAAEELKTAVELTQFHTPSCPVYQNATAMPATEPGIIQENLIKQLTSPVLWEQSIRRMFASGITEFYETGPGTVLQGLVKKTEPSALIGSVTI